MARSTTRGAARQTGPHTLADLAEYLPRVIGAAFDQAQTSAANHQKNYVALHKAHLQAAEIHNERSGDEEAGTRVFEEVFIDMVNRILPVKKGSTGGVVERLIKFVAGYIKHVGEKTKPEVAEGEDPPEDVEDNYATRFVPAVIEHLLQGFQAKDKAVRFHCVQLVAESIDVLGDIDEELYYNIRSAYMTRTMDKEASIRVLAVATLGKLQHADDEQTKGELIVDMLHDVVLHDPSADVRKTALLSMRISPSNFNIALTRIQDRDPGVRRVVYASILPRIKARHIKPTQLAQIVMTGLRDRDDTVKQAARAMVSSWVQNEQADPDDTLKVILAFVHCFEYEDREPVQLALEAIFESRRDILDQLDFTEAYWAELTVDKAILARVFVDYCGRVKDEARLERCLPVVTALAFRVQDEVNKIDELVADAAAADDEDDIAAFTDKLEDQVAAVAEMLRMTAQLDYADEIGRRKMFALVRNMLGDAGLAEPLVAPCLDVLRVLSASERDLIRVVVEIVHDVRDPADAADADDVEAELLAAEDDDDEEDEDTIAAKKAAKERKKLEEMSPEEHERVLNLDLRSLTLVIGMLERVNGSFEENSTLEGILQDLIIPSVRSKEPELRERGLVGLGLCCLIAKRMALQSFKLFLDQIQRVPALQSRVLQIVFDIMMVHEAEFLGPRAIVGEGKMIEFLLHTFEHTESDEVQSTLVVGLSKLMLSGMISDERVLKALVLAYLSPATVDNQQLRQCLAYFLPVFCYSSPRNQRMMSKIALSMLPVMNTIRDDLSEDETMVTQAQVLNLLLDWTNPENQFELPHQTRDEMVHFDLAIEMVQALYEEEMEFEDKKVVCQGLSKIFIPLEADDLKIRTLAILTSNVQRRRPVNDTTAKAALDRFDKSLHKRFGEKLDGFTDEDLRKMEALQNLFEFMDSMPEVEQEEPAPAPPKKRGGSRKVSDPTASAAKKTPARKRKKTAETDEESDDDDGTSTRASGSRAASPTPTPAREKHSRSAAPKKSLAVPELTDEDAEEEEEGSDDDDEEEEEEVLQPPTKSSKGKGKARVSLSSVASSAGDSVSELQESEDGGSDQSATPVPVARGKPAQKRKEREARTPSNRASKKTRTRSPVHDPTTPKASKPVKRVRSDVAEETSPPRKKLKEQAKPPSKRAASARTRSVSVAATEASEEDSE